MNLLQEAGDVVLAAGGPGEGVGVGGDVCRHQLGRLVPLSSAGVSDSIMVHSEAVRTTTHQGRSQRAVPVKPLPIKPLPLSPLA